MQYELEVAIALAVAGCGSLIVLYVTRTTLGKIQLPTHFDETEDSILHIHDPFDVTTFEDIIDGYPVDADAFWASVS